MKHKLVLAAAVAATLAGCATTTPTVERESAYAIYRIVPGPGVTPAQMSQAIQTALQKNNSSVQVNRGIPPSPLPETPPRFQLVNPFGGTGFAALAAQSGASLQMATCEGALATAMAQDTSMSDYGEGARFTTCLWQYQDGYHLDIHTSFTRSSGGFSPDMLGAMLARKVVGDSSQFIPRTINDLVAGLESTGSQVTLVEKYP